MVDARMLDGSRFNAAIRPVGVDGPLVSIRKFSKNKLGLHRLVEFGAITQNMAEVLAAAVHARKTTIISGGTGTGKTTMLNALSAFIPEDERLITIEDAAELQLQQPHVARMETRPANIEGHGELKQRDLVKNALRMRPDRVILGECRGEEAFDMLQAMNTGHEGSMATIHANTPRDAISRLEQMLGMTGMPMTVQSIRSQIASAIEIIVQLTRLSDGKRKVTSVAEVTGMEGDVIQMQEIFRFVRTGMEADGTILGHFEATGLRPRFLEDLRAMGIEFPGKIFRTRQAAGVSAMFDGFSMIYVIYAAAALTGIMIAEAFYLLYAGRSDRRAAINRRMKLQENKISQEQVLIQLRKERGLEGGASLFSFDRFRALRTQSGLVMPMPKFLTITSGVALAMALLAVWYGLPLLLRGRRCCCRSPRSCR